MNTPIQHDKAIESLSNAWKFQLEKIPPEFLDYRKFCKALDILNAAKTQPQTGPAEK